MTVSTSTLREMCELVVDCPHFTPEWTDTGFIVVRNQNIRDGRLDLSSPSYTNRTDFDRRNRRAKPKAGDIIFTREAPMGEVCLVPEGLECCIGQRQVLLRPRKDVDGKYLFFALRSPFVRHQIFWNEGTGSTVSNVRIPVLEALKIPRLGPQEVAIGSLLGALDDKIELNRRINETLEAMARAIFKDWFVDFGPTRAKMEGRAPYLAPDIWSLFPDRLDDEEIPHGWSRRPIYEIADVIYGAPFASALFNTTQMGTPLIRIRDLVNECPGVWTPENHPKGYKVKQGDIVVGMDGEFRAYLWGGAEAWLNQRVCVFKPKGGYSAAFVRNSIIDPLAHVEATEIATTVIHLGKNDIDRFRVSVPTAEIVEAFNDLAQPLYDQIVENKSEARILAATRDLLLPKLMSGEIRLKDAEKIVGEVV